MNLKGGYCSVGGMRMLTLIANPLAQPLSPPPILKVWLLKNSQQMCVLCCCMCACVDLEPTKAIYNHIFFSFEKHEPKTKKWGWPSMHSSAYMQHDVCLFVG